MAPRLTKAGASCSTRASKGVKNVKGLTKYPKYCRSPPQRSSPRFTVRASETGGERTPEAKDRGVGPSGLGDIEGYRPSSPAGWNALLQTLKSAGVKTISCQELKFAKDKGQTVLDIRPATQYEDEHIPGSVNVALYQPISGWSPFKIARRVGYAAFGVMNGTEVNPNFLQQVENVAGKEEGVVLVCNLGGDLEVKEGVSMKQSRSMIAAYEMANNGYQNLSVLKGGYIEWSEQGRAVEAGSE